MSQLIIGIGTGRCGTHSLAKILDSQKDAGITHELGDQPYLKWKNDPKISNVILHFRKEGTTKKFFGDVSFYYLNYLEEILREFPDAKIVSIKRDPDSTVASYMKWTEGRNHWKEHTGIRWRKCVWDDCYPKYELDKKESIQQYWKDYYLKVDELSKKYPSNFFHLNMEDLNSEKRVEDLLDFCGFESKIILNGTKESQQQYS